MVPRPALRATMVALILLGSILLAACGGPASSTPTSVPPIPTASLTAEAAATPASPTTAPTLVLPTATAILSTATAEPTVASGPPTEENPGSAVRPATDWQRVTVPITHGEALVAGPLGGPIYLNGSGVARSTDGGQTWAALSPAPPAPILAVAPGDGGIVYAGSGGACYGPGPSEDKLFHSSDGGQTWEPRTAGPGHLLVNPTNSDDLFGFTCDKVLHSTDGGKTWPQAVAPGEQLTLLAVAPADRRVLYVLSGGEGSPLTLRRSSDGGLTWSERPRPPGSTQGCTWVVVPHDGETVLCTAPEGIFASPDGGQNWQNQLGGLAQTGVQQVQYLPALAQSGADYTLYAAVTGTTPARLYRGDNLGGWTPVADLPDMTLATALVVTTAPAPPSLLLLGVNGTLYRLPTP